MKAIVLLLVNAMKMHQFKAKVSDVKPYLLCLGNISKDFTLNNMKKETWLKESVNVFYVEAKSIDWFLCDSNRDT